MPSSSCTIAWYVHCVSSGVTGSFRRSRMSSSGGTSVRRKSNRGASAVSIWCTTSCARVLASPLMRSYRTTGFFLRLRSTDVSARVCTSSASASHVEVVWPQSAWGGTA